MFHYYYYIIFTTLFLLLVAVFVPKVPVVIAEKNRQCILPPYPKNGTYAVYGNSSAIPGQILDAYYLRVSCNIGYHLNTTSDASACLHGLYSNLPECIQAPVLIAEKNRQCILPPYPKNGVYTVDGNSSAIPGQILDAYHLRVSCNIGYHLNTTSDASACLHGLYSDLPECIPHCEWKNKNTVSCGAHESTCYMMISEGIGEEPNLNDECGKVSPVMLRVISEGRNALKQEVPWHVGIYSKSFSPYKQICGGSLVSHTVVISAAHCFWNDILKQLPAEDYAVAVGKIYRPWSDPNDKLVQKSDVLEIQIPHRFLGSAANYQEDLALVVLRDAVTYSRAVRPICLDFDYAFDARQLVNGALGKVSGWGLRGEDGRPSPVLQVAEVPYIDIQACIAGASPTFRSFLSGDKICAGYTNGTAVCKGDSGGGLSFPLETEKGTRHYLRGVVSAAPQSDHLCSVYHWATFTHLLRHQHFIETLLGKKSRTELPTPPSGGTPSKLKFANQKSDKLPNAQPGSIWV